MHHCRRDDLLGDVAGGSVWRHDSSGYTYHLANCTLRRLTAAQALRCLADRTVVLIGDSLTRYSYLSLASFLVNGVWPGDDRVDESVCYEQSFFRPDNASGYEQSFFRPDNASGGRSARAQRKRSVELARWQTYFARSNKALRGAELCDCYRASSCASCSRSFVENRFLRVGSARVYFITQIGSAQWRPRGHMPPGPFEAMQQALGCSPGHCSAPFAWNDSLPDFLRRQLSAFGATDVVLNAGGHHWSAAAAPASLMRRIFEAAVTGSEGKGGGGGGGGGGSSSGGGGSSSGGSGSSKRSSSGGGGSSSSSDGGSDGGSGDGSPRAVYYRTTTAALSSRSTSTRHEATHELARRAGIGIIDTLAMTGQLRASLPDPLVEAAFQMRAVPSRKRDDLHYVCSVYRELNHVLLSVLCDGGGGHAG
jgi:hypothetical protein